jgi:ferric-dicitrate binding protein FerR (iron transport regulator)
MVRQADADLRTLRAQLEGVDETEREPETVGAEPPERRPRLRPILIATGVGGALVLTVALLLALQFRRGAAVGERYGS